MEGGGGLGQKAEGGGGLGPANLSSPGAEAAAKKWRGLINIHDLDCTHVPNFLINMPVPRELSFVVRHRAINSRAFASVPYRAAQMLNQLRRGHRAWPMFELKSGAAMAAPAAPMPPPLFSLLACTILYWVEMAL